MKNLKSTLIYFVISAGFAVFGFTQINELKVQSQWPEVMATVVSTEVVEKPEPQGPPIYHLYFTLYFTLQMDAQGEQKKVRVLRASGQRKQMQTLVEQLNENDQKISIYVSPENADEVKFSSPRQWFPYVAGFLPAILFLILALKTLKKSVEK